MYEYQKVIDEDGTGPPKIAAKLIAAIIKIRCMQFLIILSLEEEITLSAMAFRRDFFELSTVKNTLNFEAFIKAFEVRGEGLEKIFFCLS